MSARRYYSGEVWVDSHGDEWRITTCVDGANDEQFACVGPGGAVAWWDQHGNCESIGGVPHQFGRRLMRRVQ